MILQHYQTVAREATAEIEVKRSVFRCHVVRIADEAEARSVVERARSEHWDARHHCSAFIWLPDASMARSSDDGEPAGTAGAPMLEVLRGAGLTEVVAVVTRWFGGTLLGAGGLVRAYSDAVRAGLDAAGVLHRDLVTEQLVRLDHAEAARVESALRARGVTVIDTDYGSEVTLRLGVAPGQVEQVGAQLASLTQGRVAPVQVGERWVDRR